MYTCRHKQKRVHRKMYTHKHTHTSKTKSIRVHAQKQKHRGTHKKIPKTRRLCIHTQTETTSVHAHTHTCFRTKFYPELQIRIQPNEHPFVSTFGFPYLVMLNLTSDLPKSEPIIRIVLHSQLCSLLHSSGKLIHYTSTRK